MAAEGLRLDSFYMASPVCSPSRGALLTGCYPPRIGFGDVRRAAGAVPRPGASGCAPSEISLGRLLVATPATARRWSASGTAATSPTFLPTNHGFDHYFGLPVQQRHGPPGRHADRRAAATSAATRRCRCCSTTRCSSSSPTRRRSPRATSPRPCASSATPRDDPFFLYLAHMYVHLPIYVQERFARASRNGAYGAAVETIDWVTAVILARAARRSGSTSRHDRVFTSDNGSRGRDGRQQRAAARHQGHDVGGRHAGAVHRALARPHRAGPHERRARRRRSTCSRRSPRCAAPSVPADRTIDGVDISAAAARRRRGRRRASAFCYYWMNDLEAVRAGRWKLHVAKPARRSTSSTTSSPTPARRPTAPPSDPDVVARLAAIADEARRVARRRPPRHRRRRRPPDRPRRPTRCRSRPTTRRTRTTWPSTTCADRG